MFAFLLSWLFCFSATATEIKELPRLHVSGNSLALPDGRPVTLRGVSLCSLSWHDPQKLLQSVTSPTTEWNVNVVRLPVQPEEWEQAGAPDYLAGRLDPAVSQCRRNGIYCIIDWHEIDDWDNEVVGRRLEKFWRIVAPRYADEAHILYEIFNEPIGPKDRNRKNWMVFRDHAQEWVNKIRNYAPETVLLIGSPHWSQMPGFAADDPLKGENLVYTVHVYGGWKPETWEELFGKASLKIPLFLTEWGWSSLPSNRLQPFYGTLDGYARPLREYLDTRPHINWTAWSYDPHCGPAMLGSDSEMGNFVRQWLAVSRNKNSE